MVINKQYGHAWSFTSVGHFFPIYLWLDISDLGSRGIDCTIHIAKTKALISFAVAKLICVFVFAYAKSRFSHKEARLRLMQLLDIHYKSIDIHRAQKIMVG